MSRADIRVSDDWHGDRVAIAVKGGTVKGLRFAVEYLLDESRRVVPLEEGTLERSATTDVDAQQLVGSVSYDTVYAVYQHEELQLRHAPGRTSKYLERPAIEGSQTIRDLIASGVRSATEA